MHGLAALFGKDGAMAYGNMPYQEYLSQLEHGQFTLDSYPFGGYNTIVDSLFVGCPVVTWEGKYFYNRASSAVMRKVGITDLIATNRQQYIDKALSLIDNPPIYGVEEYRRRVSALDLRSILVDNDEPKYFVKAIDSILEGHGICSK
jgi:predicted O-linked N-acetylglucosamine transferase (SPINDLY family)